MNKNNWVSLCRRVSIEPADFFCGCRKILRNFAWTVDLKDKGPDLTLAEIGFTKTKLRMLEKYYVHQESVDAALELWPKRVDSGKYGSVGITTYNHFRKGRTAMGPCIQDVVFTHVKSRGQQFTAVNINYRTTEIFKKFPADLVLLRKRIMPLFAQAEAPVKEVTFTFANVTVHPMYWITLAPHLAEPIDTLEQIRENDERLWLWIVKWTGRYLCEEYFNGIEKFSQAMRTRNSGLELLPSRTKSELQRYLRKNWPGVRHKKS